MPKPREDYEDKLLADVYGDLDPEELLRLDLPSQQKARVIQLQLGMIGSAEVMELPGERSMWTLAYTSLLGECGESRRES